MCVKIVVRLLECGCIGTAGPIGCIPTESAEKAVSTDLTACNMNPKYVTNPPSHVLGGRNAIPSTKLAAQSQNSI